jgi:hypothetical protein
VARDMGVGNIAMKIKTLLLAATAVFAAGAAQAQSITFTPVASGFVTNDAGSDFDGDKTFLDASGKAYRNIGGEGGTASAKTTIDPNTVFFRSGVAVSGANASGTVTTGVDMAIYNPNDGPIALEDFTSTIIPAGMGFFMQDRNAAAGNVYLDTGPTTSATFGDLFSSVGEFTTFAGASFDFEVTPIGGDALYTLSGEILLSFDGVGNLVRTYNTRFAENVGPENFNSNLGALLEYQSFEDVVHADKFNLATTFLWDWSATQITIPLSSLGNLIGYGTKTLEYRATVSAFTNAACINDGTACLVAFSAFGDPIGRGGADEEFSVSGMGDEDQLSRGHPFHTRGFNGLGFRELELSKAQINSAAIPEPATWALMIGGFGLAGAALRRRRRTITA